MDSNIIQYFLTQGPFAVLFIWLFYSTRKEGQEREQKLYRTIDDQNEVLRKFSEKYDVIIEKLDHLENEIKG